MSEPLIYQWSEQINDKVGQACFHWPKLFAKQYEPYNDWIAQLYWGAKLKPEAGRSKTRVAIRRSNFFPH
jgi:hypothetical protein